MAATNYPTFPGMAHLRGGTSPSSSFTFTTPTQCTTLGTPRPCIATISPINLSAPGVGASWQHSIPNIMPWVEGNPPAHIGASGSTTVFTGMPYNIQQVLPQESGNNEFTCRVKRKAMDVPSEAPLSKVHICADQLANMRISPHQDAAENGPDYQHSHSRGSSTYDLPFGGAEPGALSRAEQWQRFRELESRLVADCDGSSSQTPSLEGSKKIENDVRVVVANGVLEAAQTSPILPRAVMEDITKPCMQLVLWQSPEKLIQAAGISSEDNTSSIHSTDQTSSSSSSDLSISSTSSIHNTQGRTFPLLGGKSGEAYSMDTAMVGSVEPAGLCSQPCALSAGSTVAAFSRPNGTSSLCHLSASPDFLRLVSSSGDSHPAPFSSSSPNFASMGSNSRFFHNNNNIDGLNSNNNNNVMDMFDSIDDDMQL